MRIAVLDFGASPLAVTAADTLCDQLSSRRFVVIDRDLVRTAARGNGYDGSLNMSRADARTLGSALGAEFYILGDAQTTRRSPSTAEPFFESYASIFFVSSRTGNLISWERRSFKSSTAELAEKLLLADLKRPDTASVFYELITQAFRQESTQRATFALSEPIIEEAPVDENAADAEGLRLPKPFRRIKPTYTDDAARADTEATVDVLVDIDDKGEVRHAEIERWAGFGLDQASLETVKQLHFFPAMRDGHPIPMRVLLRYNFRKPPKTT